MVERYSAIVSKHWDYDRNTRNPAEISPGSGVVVFWKCEHGHSFARAVRKFVARPHCLVCNSAGATSPLARRLWHPTRNGRLTAEDVGRGSERRVWWQCEAGHEWQALVSNIVRGKGCPFCLGRLASAEDNFATRFPSLVAEWDPEKNSKPPTDFRPFSDTVIWWRCDRGHSWSAPIKARAVGKGCPYCSGRLATAENNLEGRFPSVAQQWCSNLNLPLTPRDVSPGSKKTVWWQCERGHRWRAQVVNRTTGRTSCPFCQNKKAAADNCLASLRPEIAAEWHPKMNGSLTAEAVVPGSNKRVWWQCRFHHEWRATVASRTKENGTGCPFCGNQSSKLEIRLYAELLACFPDTKWRAKIAGQECDVFIPTLNLAVEVDGAHWHKGKAAADKRKNEVLCKAGVSLLRIRELPLARVSQHDVLIHKDEDHHLVLNLALESIAALASLPNKAAQSLLGRIASDHFQNEALYRKILAWLPAPPAGLSLSDTHPALSSEWDPEGNAPLRPQHFHAGSKTHAWWKCDNGHRWKARIDHRAKGVGCPACSGRVATPVNNLAVKFPEVAKFWCHERNGALTPGDVTPKSNKRVWWECSAGHRWDNKINNQVKLGKVRCPFCEHRRPSAAYNLAVCNAEVAAEWHPEKNGGKRPGDVLPRSNKKAWWLCRHDHVWQATINSRSSGRGCPYCAGRKTDVPR